MPSRSEVITPARARHLLDREPGEDLDAAAVALAHRYDTVVSLYGHVPCPTGGAGGRRAATPGLATSGSGDVLAGLLAGLLSRGAEPAHARWAAFAHVVSGQPWSPGTTGSGSSPGSC